MPGHGHLWLRPPAPVAWCVTGLFAVASAVLAHLAVTSEECVCSSWSRAPWFVGQVWQHFGSVSAGRGA